MAEYKVMWIRPTVYLGLGGEAVEGYKVRILLYPWNEVRDLQLPDNTAELIDEAAKIEVEKRLGVDALGETPPTTTKRAKKS